ncbi:ATP-binding cassette domain-containing protein, partial [Streptomyces celluloflavus]
MTTTTLTEQPAAADTGTAAPYAVRIDHVSKAFGRPGAQQHVLDDISIDVAPGEFVCLLGASGCGKSTLLNLVAGLDAPSAGGIETPGGRP